MVNLCKTDNSCCGCGLCSVVCPKSVLAMKQDKEGFFYPSVINYDACIHCNKCEKYCPELNRISSPREVISCYSGYASDEYIIRECASGGLATVISINFIKSGGVVYGVQYSSDFECVEYGRADSVEQLDRFKASKYAQSIKSNTFVNVLSDLKAGRKVLFIGLPCDIAAINNYTKKYADKLFTMELICHGVTSPLVHKQFICNLKQRFSSNIVSFSLRHKKDAWKPYYIKTVFENGITDIELFRPTSYGIAFHYLKRPSCNNCRFKIYDKEFGLQADLTIGDNHGVRPEDPSYNHWGSSMFFVHSKKGSELVDCCKENFIIKEEKSNIIKHNLALFRAIKIKKERKLFVKTFTTKGLNSTRYIWLIRLKDFKISIRKKIGLVHVKIIRLFNKMFSKHSN